jgi:choline dehydrogenase-like flavoprotein
MGIDSDSVVDPELRVYGIRNLRVADGSIMPEIPASHTNSVIFMIGEKASDLIKKTWKSF